MIRRRLTGLAASLAIAAIVVGMPIVLATVGGNPIPTRLPTPAEILGWITTPDDGTLALTAIILAGWLVWAFLAITIVAELAAAVRGVRAPAMPGLRLPQDAARRLVTTAALLFVAAPAAALTSPALAGGNPTPPPVTAQAFTAAPHDGHGQDSTATAAGEVAATVLEHVVEPGDTLSDVAATYLGDPDRWPEIYEATRGVTQPDGRQLTDPDMIEAGWTLNIPTSNPQPVAAQNTAMAEHVVAPEETLSSVAETYLGDADRWPEIFEATRGVTQPDGRHLTDPDVIDPGWTLRIPALAAAPVVQAVPEAPPAAPVGVPVPEPSPATVPPPPSTGPSGPTSEPSERAATPSPAPGGGASAPASDGVVSAEPAPPEASIDHEVMSARWLLSGVAGGIVLSASALLVLASRRRQQQRERRPGRMIATPPPEIAPVEKTIITVGTRSLPTVERMDEALRRLADTRTSAVLPMPPLVAAELRTDGSVVLHLAEPVTDLGSPWQQDDPGQMVWRLPAETDLAAVGYLPDYQPAPYPLLVTCGSSDDGDTWLLNLEQLATIKVIGDPIYTADFFRYLVTELAVNPWSRAAKLTTTGLDDDLASIDAWRLTTAPTVKDAISAVRRDAEFTVELAARVDADTATGRAGGLGDEAWGAHTLIVHTTDHDPDVDGLIGWTAQHPGRTGAAVVVSGPCARQGTQIRLTPAGRVIIDGLGLDLVAVGLTSDEARGCAILLATSDDTRDVPMPVDAHARAGWQALADRAGALRPELAIPKENPNAELSADASSLIPDNLPLPDSALEEDLELLAPKVPGRLRTTAEQADPTLDADVADWFSAACPRPRLALLGPVTVRAHGKPISKRKPFSIEVLSFIALHEHGVRPDEIVTAFGFGTTSSARNAVSGVRDWLGNNPRTGHPHLPSAHESRAGKAGGIGVYQVEDLLIDIDLFKRLRVRGQTRGPDGIKDLETAIQLVRGQPFDQLRSEGWTWLVDTGEQHHMTAAIADVAHILVTHYLQTRQLQQARQTAQAAILAVPDDHNLKTDLLVITMAEGRPELALRLYEEMCNQPDEDGIPLDIGERTQQLLANLNSKRAARVS